MKECRVIAVVGLSAQWHRPSYFAAKYMLEHGYRVIPVNPQYSEVLGQKCYASLRDIAEKVDLVDVFRKTADVLPVAEDAVAIGAKVFWQQLGVKNEAAAALARSKGLETVMDRCVKIEHGRLFGGLNWMGVNTKVISAKRPRWLAIVFERRTGRIILWRLGIILLFSNVEDSSLAQREISSDPFGRHILAGTQFYEAGFKRLHPVFKGQLHGRVTGKLVTPSCILIRPRSLLICATSAVSCFRRLISSASGTDALICSTSSSANAATICLVPALTPASIWLACPARASVICVVHREIIASALVW